MKRRLKSFLLILCAFIMLGSMKAHAEDFTIRQTKVTMNTGDSLVLETTETSKNPVWLSYNENTAKVDQNGKVTAIRQGKTFIRARAGFKTSICSVNVVTPSIKLNKSTATIYHGGTSVNTIQLKATVKGTTKDTVWTSSNPEVAKVDSNGEVTSVSEGTALITATANGKSARCTVTVKESSTSLNMDQVQLSNKGIGSSVKLTASVIGSKKNIKWDSSDKTIATVSSGKVTGKKNGTATITATANGISDTCTVTVTDGLVSIDEEKLLLYTGETKQLKTNAGKQDVLVWSSSDESVVTVVNGLVTAKEEGRAMVSVECNGKKDTCEVRVKNTVTAIEEENVSLRTKGTDKTYQLNSTIAGRNSSVKWTSSNGKVVTVSKGKLTAKSAGTATVTATANGISDSVQVTVEDYLPTISLNQSSYVLYTTKGNTVTLKASVDGKSKTVSWNSSDNAVATVNNKGKVTASGEGETVISATANGVTSECVITVRQSRVILEKENLHLDKGETGTIPVDVIGISQSIKWSTSNSKVATVKNGVVTAKNYGEADIKVTANGITSICYVNVSNCQHDFEGNVTKQPTCTEEGTCVYTCKYCDDSYSESVPKTEHKWSEWVIVKAPTENEAGIQVRSCDICGMEETSILPVVEHVHKYESTVTEPTCEKDGYTTYECSCGDIYTDNIVPALGHKWNEWITLKEPTDKEEGKMYRVCELCKEEETKIIPVIGHEHKYNPKVTEPTCIKDGYTTYECSCGDSYVGDIIPASGHKWSEWVTVKEATEKEEGKMCRVCDVCKEEETKIIPIVGQEHKHEYVSTVTEPTCTKDGYTIYQCSCGDSYTGEIIPAYGHKWSEWIVVKEATAKEQGEKYHVCEICKEKESEFIPIVDHTHKYSTTVVEPTCAQSGYTIYSCECGDSYHSDYVEHLSHVYSDWIIKQEPTCTEIGSRIRECTLCGLELEGASIEPTGHSFDDGVITKEMTCTENGELTYTCVSCGAVKVQTLSTTGHKYGEFKDITEPLDFETFGVSQMVCPVCDTVLFDDLTSVLIDIGNDETGIVYGYYDKEEAMKCFELTYAYKEENGFLPTSGSWVYEWNESRYNYSCIRCAEMAYNYETIGDATHNRPNGEKLICGENLTYKGHFEAGSHDILVSYSAEDAFAAWLSSKAHRETLEDHIDTTTLAKFTAWIPEWEGWASFWVQNFHYD